LIDNSFWSFEFQIARTMQNQNMRPLISVFVSRPDCDKLTTDMIIMIWSSP